MPRETKGRDLKTVTTSLEILNFVKENNEAKLSDIADQFDMAKSTAHGYLATLEKNGMLVEENGCYLLGLRLFHLGEWARNRNRLYSLAKPKVSELADRLGEGVNFLIQENGRMFTIYNIISTFNDPIFKPGQCFHMHNTVAGKAVLAELSDSRIDEILNKWGLPRATTETIVRKDELMDEIKTIRQQGYATIDGELVTGFRAVGVAVNYPDGRVFGVFGVGGPTYRIDDERLYNEIPSVLKRTVNELEDEISEELRS